MNLIDQLKRLPVPVYLTGVSAMGHYLSLPPNRIATIRIAGDLVDIAKIFDSPEQIGFEGIDAVVPYEEYLLLVQCSETPPAAAAHSDNDLDLWHYDLSTERFIDQGGVYQRLRKGVFSAAVKHSTDMVYTAIALSQLPLEPETGLIPGAVSQTVPADIPAEAQRILLEGILAGENADRGLDILQQAGWITRLWPIIDAMRHTEQGKSEHPEGDVWQHSLQALTHRKSLDPRVGLAVLLHDAGKPHAEQTAEHRFHLHADIGAKLAYRFLSDLGFPHSTVQDVVWLIRYHSFPGALSRLPGHRAAPLMRNPLFPLLLELYRCDLSATYRGPENYYRACAVYRRFLKNHHNPFRDQDGKKLVNLLVE
ncbi:MAG: HD domain-containing protein [Spirochaeta sp.]